MTNLPLPRRSFLARFGLGAAAVPALAAAACNPAAATAAAPADELETWFATFKGSQKVIYDCVNGSGGVDGILFARSFLKYSADKLGTKDGDMSVVISFRHFASPHGYNDAMWAKYPLLSGVTKSDDPATKKAATRNVFLHEEIPGFPGASLPALAAKGVQFTVCGAATEVFAGLIAGKTGNAKAIEDELRANLIPSARIVPAGVVGVQHAQKAGFAYTFAG